MSSGRQRTPRRRTTAFLKLVITSAILTATVGVATLSSAGTGYARDASVRENFVRTTSLYGSYDTVFQGVTTTGKAKIAASSLARRAICRLPPNSTSCPLKLENQFGEYAYGSYAGQKIEVTAGSWPDADVAHPLVGTVTLSADDKVTIQWGALKAGKGSGGSWTSTHSVK
jgi:hypothetical protein